MSAALAAAVFAGYALGCLCGAYYLTRWLTGEDIRTLHTGNAGATNAGRVLGKKGYALTLLWDAAKGAAAAGIGWRLGGDAFTAMAALFAAVLGHIHPAQLDWRGGKGLATAWGGGWVICWPVSLALLLIAVAVRPLFPRGDFCGYLLLSVFPLLAFLLRPFDGATLLALALAVLMLANYGGELPRPPTDA